MKKRNMTLLTAISAAAAFASSAQAAVILVNNTTAPNGTNSDFRTALNSGATNTNVLPGRILAGANTGKMIFGDITINVSSLITGVNSADTYVDAADFNANAVVSLNFTVVVLNITNSTDSAGTATRTFTIYTDPVAGITGQGTVGATLGTTTAGLGAKSISLTANASGYELGAMATDALTLNAFTTGNGTAEYEFTNKQLVVTRAIPEPASMSLLALSGLALLRRRRA